jgi:hypothetical protein
VLGVFGFCCIFFLFQNDDGDFADIYKQPDVYVNAEDIGRGREYYPDIGKLNIMKHISG